MSEVDDLRLELNIVRDRVEKLEQEIEKYKNVLDIDEIFSGPSIPLDINWGIPDDYFETKE